MSLAHPAYRAVFADPGAWRMAKRVCQGASNMRTVEFFYEGYHKIFQAIPALKTALKKAEKYPLGRRTRFLPLFMSAYQELYAEPNLRDIVARTIAPLSREQLWCVEESAPMFRGVYDAQASLQMAIRECQR